MSATKAKAPTNSSSRIAALEQRVHNLEAVVKLQSDTLQRVVNSQVAVLTAFEQLVNEARKANAET